MQQVKETKKKIIGWKNFNKDLSCRGFKFEVGKTYEVSGKVVMCRNGFHFHQNSFDLFKYYDKDSLVCKVEASGDIYHSNDKSVCQKIKIIKIIKEGTKEFKKLGNMFTNMGWGNSGNRNSGDRNSGNCNSGNRNSGDRNSGYYNSGNCNSGNRNSGDYNSGNCNSGNYNSGDYNSGNYNSGNCNSGNCNSGNRNSGNYNSGYYNSGDRNSGNWNSCSYESGFFNSKTSNKIRVFNNLIDKELWDNSIKPNFIFFNLNKWIDKSNMTEQEKKDNPSYETTGGYLKQLTYKGAWKESYNNATERDIELLKALPGFNKKVFKEISGIDIK